MKSASCHHKPASWATINATNPVRITLNQSILSRACSTCSKGEQDSWFCLHCNSILCGQLTDNHVKVHSKGNSLHALFYSIEKKFIWCQLCEMVISTSKTKEFTQMKSTINKLFNEKSLKKHIDSLTSNKSSPRSNLKEKSASSWAKEITELKTGQRNAYHKNSNRKTTRKKFKHITGISNMSNTCYMNSILQTFCHSKVIKEKYYRYDTANHVRTFDETTMELELKLLLNEMWNTSSSLVYPAAFHEAFLKRSQKFGGYDQQDSQEFIAILLELLNTEALEHLKQQQSSSVIHTSYIPTLGDTGKAVTHEISGLFTGELMDTICCLNCKHTTTRGQLFKNLSLSIPKFGSSVSIEDCLHSFVQDEILAEKICDNCKYAGCSKKLTIKEFPEILCLHIQRADSNVNTRHSSKNDTKIKFSLSGLDLSPFVYYNKTSTRNTLHPIYDLYSCIVHDGDGAGGHFKNYSWCEEEGDWFLLNDNAPSVLNEEKLLHQNPYLLFYSLRKNSATPNISDINSSNTNSNYVDGRDSSPTPSLSSSSPPSTITCFDDGASDDEKLLQQSPKKKTFFSSVSAVTEKRKVNYNETEETKPKRIKVSTFALEKSLNKSNMITRRSCRTL
ncbi:Ubiquitin carboxyl-terminal hydrolase 21 [Clydaea vesicula]|uniref:Ubiquitin carboxyl-terminal hydrolase 21 n=1 Tax=Clydaea vesicula TaxID=447962 RepID=A0AAD5U5M9_9FUNG|nr:Ubiquitin carboxyl-terminal hydrolase 21 [Clydaea vesicula]